MRACPCCPRNRSIAFAGLYRDPVKLADACETGWATHAAVPVATSTPPRASDRQRLSPCDRALAYSPAPTKTDPAVPSPLSAKALSPRTSLLFFTLKATVSAELVFPRLTEGGAIAEDEPMNQKHPLLMIEDFRGVLNATLLTVAATSAGIAVCGALFRSPTMTGLGMAGVPLAAGNRWAAGQYLKKLENETISEIAE